MSWLELLLIAAGLSIDAFAVAVCAGLCLRRVTFRHVLSVGLYFGVFQAVMPLFGYLLATQLPARILAFDHWVAFVLLAFIGGKMIWGSSDERPIYISLRVGQMLTLAVATSIDALAVGVSFAFLEVDIVPAVLCIGLVTLTMCMVGVKVGGVVGIKFRRRAELAGGMVLVLIGLNILRQGLGISLPFL